MRLGRAASAAAAAAALALTRAGAAPTADYGVNPAEVYAVDWQELVPADPEAETIDLQDLGTCTCDLTLYACDPDCCCDEDCLEADQLLFGPCRPEGPEEPSLLYCTSDSTLVEVNLPSGSSLGYVKRQQADDGFFESQLCIVDDNNAALGRFFVDPPAATAAMLDAALVEEADYFWTGKAVADPSDVDTKYSVGSPVVAKRTVVVNATSGETVDRALPEGVFMLPAPTLSAACVPFQVVGFMQDVPFLPDERRSECQVATEALAAECASAYDAAALVTELRLGVNDATAPAYLSPVVTSLSYAFAGLRSAGTEVAMAVPEDGSTLPSAEYDAATGTCSNALKSVEYTLAHANGKIEAVSAAVVLTDVVADAAGAGVLTQGFSVSFVGDGVNAGNVRPKSGVPGYLAGYPLLAGVLTTDGSLEAISRLKDGLPVLSAGAGGYCVPNARSPVLFDTNQLSSCRIPFSAAALKAFCKGEGTLSLEAYLEEVLGGGAASGDAPTAAVPLPVTLLDGLLFADTGAGSLAGNRTFVAPWADADANNIAEWTAGELELLAAPELEMAWDEDTLTCSNVVTGVSYDFLTALVGALTNPQSKVAAAQVGFSYSTWTFRDGAVAAEGGAQSFVLSSSVRFAPQDQESAKGISPDAPPLFPSLPEDILYPFMINGASGSKVSWVLLAGVVLLAALPGRAA